jgi:hypothetical protein
MLIIILLYLFSPLSQAVEPVSTAAREADMAASQMNPPWQATDPTNLNSLGLPPEMAGKDGVSLRAGAYPSGRAIASEKYGLIDNPQAVHAIGPTYGLQGAVAAPTDRPRFYPSDVLTAPEPTTITPPAWFKSQNILFNPKGNQGFTPGQMYPVKPVPCSTYDSNGSGLCNEAPTSTKSVVDQLMKVGPMAMIPPKPLGKR